ncbi:hypothetical protein DAPPUDRAFT_114825 [Daphnia pulex]|uniref:Uncharacterized protein n=1 Tax=Daphnia pulex TaxID=6669 RepID=E9HJC6_DAPPU|nr:hypothetical protein DAPPUDRAFT_114825 [Daphnia pulex]|eukprot:EFX68148.1 hypothetical protein DAPPUDRAFT_114825 [Daphnia pulex]
MATNKEDILSMLSHMTHSELQEMLIKSGEFQLLYTHKSWEVDTLVPYLERKVAPAPSRKENDSWSSSSSNSNNSSSSINYKTFLPNRTEKPTGCQSWMVKKVMMTATGKFGEDQNMEEACEEEKEGLGQAMGGDEEVGIENKVEQNEEGGEFKLE